MKRRNVLRVSNNNTFRNILVLFLLLLRIWNWMNVKNFFKIEKKMKRMQWKKVEKETLTNQKKLEKTNNQYLVCIYTKHLVTYYVCNRFSLFYHLRRTFVSYYSSLYYTNLFEFNSKMKRSIPTQISNKFINQKKVE